MMSSSFYGAAPPVHNHHDAFLEELSQQMAMSQAQAAWRLSRGLCNGQQRVWPGAANAMRVAKPSSTKHSPRSSTMASRRRTMVNDSSLAARRRQLVDQASSAQEMSLPQSRPSRPLSWHPSSFPQYQMSTSAPHYQQQQHQYLNQYPFPPTVPSNDHDFSTAYSTHVSPTPAAYSCSTSPNPAFSPLSLPFNAFDSAPYLSAEGWNIPTQSTPGYVSSSHSNCYLEPFPAMSEADILSSSNQWNPNIGQCFSSTSPPTPENLPQTQQPQPAVSTESPIAYHPLAEPEEEGEILVGMGLYDTPDKHGDDPHLSNSRSAMSSLLGGSPFRGGRQGGPGKGLKLEEAWQPPESDDDEGDAGTDDGEDDEPEANDAVPAIRVGR